MDDNQLEVEVTLEGRVYRVPNYYFIYFYSNTLFLCLEIV